MLYGSSPLPERQAELRPVLALKTRITLIRDLPAGHGVSYGRTFITPRPMRVATLAIGYADGCDRHLSNTGADLLIHGRRCPLLGRVTMDQIMVDVSHVAEAAIADEAVLIGRSGAEQILASELAAKAGTIAWEIFTSIGPRVDRVYP
jgi:alanine racemase